MGGRARRLRHGPGEPALTTTTPLRHHRDFRLYWAARQVSVAGTLMTAVALPVLVYRLSGSPALTALVTVAEVTTSARGIGAEVEFDHDEAGLDRPSVINCDGLHTITRSSLTTYAGAVSEGTMERVCAAVVYALGC